MLLPMEKSKIERINALARKSKTKGLTDEERTEQTALRNEYRAEIRASLIGELNSTVIVDEQGNVVRRLADIGKKDPAHRL